MKTNRFPTIVTIIVLTIIVLIVFNIQIPTEVVGAMCVVVPATVTGLAGYFIGKYGRPHLRLEFDGDRKVSACAACGHNHPDAECECGCQAFVEP